MVIPSHFLPANRHTERKHSIALLMSAFLLAVIYTLISKQGQPLTPYEFGHAVGEIVRHLFGDLWFLYIIYKAMNRLKN